MFEKFTVESVDFGKIETPKALIDIFIKIAKTCPKQMDRLFEKYVAYIQKGHGTSELAAIRNLSLLADSRGPEIFNLICNNISAMKHMVTGNKQR